MVRYFNPGTFVVPTDHQLKAGERHFPHKRVVDQMVNTIVKLSYK